MEVSIVFMALWVSLTGLVLGLYAYNKIKKIKPNGDKDKQDEHYAIANGYRMKLQRELLRIKEEENINDSKQIYKEAIGYTFEHNRFTHSFVAMYNLKKNTIQVLIYGATRLKYGLKMEMNGLAIEVVEVNDGKYCNRFEFWYAKRVN